MVSRPPQSSKCFVEVMGAENGPERCEPRPKNRSPGKCEIRITRKSHSFNVLPLDFRAIQAEADRRTWNSAERAGAAKFSFFNGRDNCTLIVNQSRCWVMPHR